MTDIATNPTSSTTDTTATNATDEDTDKKKVKPANEGLALTLDKDLTAVLGPVLRHLEQYKGRSPAAAVLEVEQEGNDRRLKANRQIIARLDRVAELRTKYQNAGNNRLNANHEIDQLKLDLEFGIPSGPDGDKKRKALEAKLKKKNEEVESIDAEMATLATAYRADDASGLDTQEKIGAAQRRHAEATGDLATVDQEIAALENDSEAEDREANLEEARRKRGRLTGIQATATNQLIELRRTAVDQTITDQWDPTAGGWGIDSSIDPSAFTSMRQMATDAVERIDKRQAKLSAELESAQKEWADGSGKAIAKAIRGLRQFTDPTRYRKLLKAQADTAKQAKEARAEADELLADIDEATGKIAAEYKAKGAMSPVEVRRMAKRMQAAENKLLDTRGSILKKADKLGAAALDANNDLLVLKNLDALRKAIPKDAYDYDLVDSLVTSARLAAMEKSTDKVLAGLHDNIDQLKKPGSKIERALDLEAGVALEAIGVARLRLTALYGLMVGIEHSDDGTYKAKISNSIGIKMGVKAGFDSDQTKGMALASARGDGLIGQERVYKSLNDLLTAERALIVEAVLKGAGTKTSKKDRSFLKRRQELIAKQRINEASLNTRLRRVGVKGQVKSAAYKRVEVVKTDIKGRSETFEAQAVFQVVDPLAPNPVGISMGGGAKAKFGHATKEKYKTFSFVNDIADNAALQELHMLKADTGLARVDITRLPEFNDNGDMRWRTTRRSMGHDQTAMHYRSIDSLVTSLKAARDGATNDEAKAAAESSMLNVGTELRTELETLRAEYDMFVDLSREVPTEKVTNAARREQRERLMKARGIGQKEVAAYVRSVALQYSVLRRLCESANEPFENTARDILRPPKNTHLDSFKEDLQTPRVKMSDAEAKRVFGDDATADLESVESTELAVNANIAVTTGGKQKKGSDELKGKIKLPSLNLSFAYQKEEKFKKGIKGPADTSVSVVIDGNFNLSGSGMDNNTGLSDSAADDKIFMANLMAKLFDVRSLKKLGVEKDPALVDEAKKAIMSTMIQGNGTMKIDMKVVNGQLRLRRVQSLEEKKRNVGVGASIPTTGLFNVAVSVNASQNKTKVLSVYHGSNTLSELTNLYRTEKTDGNDDRWNEVKKDSKLLRRVLAEVSKTALNRTVGWAEKGRTPQMGETLATVMKGIKDGSQQKGADKIEVFWLESRSNIAVGASNELVDWLIDLKTSKDEKDRDAADKFIDGWLAKSKLISSKNKKSQPQQYEDAMDDLETLFETVVARKTALENTKADDPFVKKRGFSRAFLNDYVAGKLYTESNLLGDQLRKLEGGNLTKAPRSVDGLRRRALRLHKSLKTKETRELVEDVLALDYASKTLDDLTKFDDDHDKDEAIGMLGADIDKLLRGHRKGRTASNNNGNNANGNNANDAVPKPKVYVNSLIEADLEVEADGKFKLVPVIKKGQARIVKKNMLEKEIELVRKSMNADAGVTTDTGSLVSVDIGNTKMISDHHGNPTIPWKNKYYSSKARNEYFEKQKGKKGAIIYTRSAAKRDLRSHGNNSIGEKLRALMDARARAEQRKQAAQQNRKKASQASSSMSN